MFYYLNKISYFLLKRPIVSLSFSKVIAKESNKKNNIRKNIFTLFLNKIKLKLKYYYFKVILKVAINLKKKLFIKIYIINI